VARTTTEWEVAMSWINWGPNNFMTRLADGLSVNVEQRTAEPAAAWLEQCGHDARRFLDLKRPMNEQR
jgi:hypothetical protein